MQKQLSEHTITTVKGGIVRNLWPRLIGRNGKFGWSHGYGYNNNIVIIETDSGFMGWGIGVADTTLKYSLEGLKLSDVFNPSVGILNTGLRAADIALHDLAGNILNIPVSKMINPDSQMTTPCYDGAIYFNDLTDRGDLGADIVLDNCRDDYAKGYTDFKVKIGRGTWLGEEGLKRDIEIIRRIRKEYPNSNILVDANDSMDLQTVLRFMDSVKDCSIYWIEEPFAENYDDYAKLKEYLVKNSPHTLIADGEFEYDTNLVIDLAKKGVIDCLLMDPESYGYTLWRKLINECKGTNIKCSPHCWGTKLKTNTVAHLAAAFPEVVPTIEGVPETLEGIDESEYIMENGILHIPEKSGFGMKLEYAAPKAIHTPY